MTETLVILPIITCTIMAAVACNMGYRTLIPYANDRARIVGAYYDLFFVVFAISLIPLAAAIYSEAVVYKVIYSLGYIVCIIYDACIVVAIIITNGWLF
jgi:hypothetical protein